MLTLASPTPNLAQQFDRVTVDHLDHVSVDQLEQEVAAMHGKPDREVAQQLGNLRLTQRLSTSRLQRINAELSGEKLRQTLLALADESAFLDLPGEDFPKLAAPDRETQGKMISQAASFVAAAVPKMPNFLATRTTMRFQDVRITIAMDEPVILASQNFHLIDTTRMVALYRDGNEVDQRPNSNKSAETELTQPGLTNWGVFGPLLGVVMKDVLNGKIGWSHWEQGDGGALAVFRYAVAEHKSTYMVKYCCIADQAGKMQEFNATPAYHGEIAFDPGTGAVLRLVVETDLRPGLKISRADILVEYGSVEIGGKSYICPLRSVSISTATDLVTKGVQYKNSGSFTKIIGNPKVTSINDVVFDNYHLFRSEMRILPPEGGASPQ
jgi:hypothetical protein